MNRGTSLWPHRVSSPSQATPDWTLDRDCQTHAPSVSVSSVVFFRGNPDRPFWGYALPIRHMKEFPWRTRILLRQPLRARENMLAIALPVSTNTYRRPTP